MPDSVVYLLILLGAMLVIGGFTKPQTPEGDATRIKQRIADRIRHGLHQYRRGGIILGAMVVGIGVYGSSTGSPDASVPEPAASSSTAAGFDRYRTFESDFIKIELPGGWTTIDGSGLDISDLRLSELPRAVRRSISAIPTENNDLHLFAFDKDYQATLVIMSSGIDATNISTLLDRRRSLYDWIGVPVAAAQAGLQINGMEAGTLVIEPIHRFELFREKQYLVTTEKNSYIMIFSTMDHYYQDHEPVFEEIASSFQVLFGL